MPLTLSDLPFSQACENNKQPILDKLLPLLTERSQVFEIGSGTGQHAVYFAQQLPHITWQTADLADNVPAIQARIQLSGAANLPPPVTFDMNSPAWPAELDCVYSANTAHIMPWPTTQNMIRSVAYHLPRGGRFFLYGPFNDKGEFSSPSNQAFDQWLKSKNPRQGIRDFEAIQQIASAGQLTLLQDYAMPANNRLLVWQKT